MAKKRSSKAIQCHACDDRGWLLSLNVDRDVYEIQRCDSCFRFKTDRKAGDAAVPLIEEALSLRGVLAGTHGVFKRLPEHVDAAR